MLAEGLYLEGVKVQLGKALLQTWQHLMVYLPCAALSDTTPTCEGLINYPIECMEMVMDIYCKPHNFKLLFPYSYQI